MGKTLKTIRCVHCSLARDIELGPKSAWLLIKDGWIRMFDWINRRELYFCCAKCEESFKTKKSSELYDLLLKTKRTN